VIREDGLDGSGGSESVIDESNRTADLAVELIMSEWENASYEAASSGRIRRP